MSETVQAPAPLPPLPPRRAHRRRAAVLGGATALGIAAGAVFGFPSATPGTTSVRSLTAQPDSTVLYGERGGLLPPGGTPGGGATGSAVASATEATADQLVGVVDITTVLGYAGGEAAGTGMVVTGDGEVLTNNHVVDGATSITVTVLSTGDSYTATVVGTDPTDDVAVLQLDGADGLDTVQVDQDAVSIGDAVTAVGNAGGAAGTSAAAGTVTALDRSITATDASGGDAEQLTGLIGIAADVEAGDSGGPLYDAEGEVTGMDTAASSTGGQAYAIPIATALHIARQITDGVDDATVHQGYPAFLGVSLTDGAGGATVAGTVAGGPAAQAGLAADDVITTVGGTTTSSAADVSSALAALDPGDRVIVTWTDATGTAQSATVVLATGPAD